MYKIAICDDDKRYRKTIREIVEHENSLHENEIRFYEYESGNELLKHTDILHELVFIDIRMPGLDGNQTALKLRNYNKDAVLIFCSSYFEPTVDSINFGQPFRYIMKDLHDTSLRREIAAIMTEVKRRFLNDYAVTVTSAGKIIRIHVENILYVSRAKSELEELIIKHPDIMDCAVIGIEDEMLGNKICVYAVARKNISLLDIRKHLEEAGIAMFKLPDVLRLVKRIPVTAMKKVDKEALRILEKEHYE